MSIALAVFGVAYCLLFMALLCAWGLMNYQQLKIMQDMPSMSTVLLALTEIEDGDR